MRFESGDGRPASAAEIPGVAADDVTSATEGNPERLSDAQLDAWLATEDEGGNFPFRLLGGVSAVAVTAAIVAWLSFDSALAGFIAMVLTSPLALGVILIGSSIAEATRRTATPTGAIIDVDIETRRELELKRWLKDAAVDSEISRWQADAEADEADASAVEESQRKTG